MTTNTSRSLLPTTRQLVIREALYQGRHAAIEVRCGAASEYRTRRARWEAIAAKSGWTSELLDEGWNAYCTSFAAESIDDVATAQKFVDAVDSWKQIAGL